MHWRMQFILSILIPNQSNCTIQHLQLGGHNLPQSISKTWYFCSPIPRSTAGSLLAHTVVPGLKQTDVPDKQMTWKPWQLFPIPDQMKWHMSLIGEEKVQRCKWKQPLTICKWPLPNISTQKWQSLSFSIHRGFLVGFINLVALTNHSLPELQAVLRNRISNFKERFFKV